MVPHPSGIRLQQVNTPEDGQGDSRVDVIAIHGLDTRSPETWTWKSKTNWLSDGDMLPHELKHARIFTLDWPSSLLQESLSIPSTVKEYGVLLLAGIHDMRLSSPPGEKNRPILFISSCFGGLILMHTLLIADQDWRRYATLRRAIRGMIFLATPFRGTSFQDIAYWATPLLKGWASLQVKQLTPLLDSVKDPAPLEDVVRQFTQLLQRRYRHCRVVNFYETVATVLERKAIPSLVWDLTPPPVRQFIFQPTLLVDKSSATLDIVPDPLPLEGRAHVQMNKFKSPTDPGYESIVRSIRDILQCPSPLDQADAWILEKCYDAGRVQIVRLSGDLLPMDQCYINLAIIEQCRTSQQPLRNENEVDTSSPPSLFSRLRVDQLDDDEHCVDLPALFNPREQPRLGTDHPPRRILIRGRAGVGKTTLCKKIVHDFARGELWRGMFDRVLWVPLRRIKAVEGQIPSLTDIFRNEFFSQHTDRDELATEIKRELDLDAARTLFILDGFDEISPTLDHAFLRELLDQPSIILTSRPYAALPSGHLPFDLELETIGFYPRQVDEYLSRTHAESPDTAAEIKSFINEHWLVQGLVRIPIQLDALCYAWEDGFSALAAQQTSATMTTVYRGIEQRLWKKDVLRVDAPDNRAHLRQEDIADLTTSEIEALMDVEIKFLEYLAFTGQHNSIVEFGKNHRGTIFQQYKALDSALDRVGMRKLLPRLSFLRTSDASNQDKTYHFLHLTFQEYFAAKYFARHWQSKQPLQCLNLSDEEVESIQPADFVRNYKYTGHYDIQWRFVCGLLEDEGPAFLSLIEEEPIDLLGPMHLRLVMNLSSEIDPAVDTGTLEGGQLRHEETLKKWLLTECQLARSASLASEAACSEKAVQEALLEAPYSAKLMILKALMTRPKISHATMELVVTIAETCSRNRERYEVAAAALRVLGRDQHLPDDILSKVARLSNSMIPRIWKHNALEIVRAWSRLSLQRSTLEVLRAQSNLSEKLRETVEQGTFDDQEEAYMLLVSRCDEKDVRKDVLEWLQDWASCEYFHRQLPEKILKILASCLDDSRLVHGSSMALYRQSSLPPSVVNSILRALEGGDARTRPHALIALSGARDLPELAVQAISARIEDRDPDVRSRACHALSSQSRLPKKTLDTLVARIKRQDVDAIRALYGQERLPDGALDDLIRVARLEMNENLINTALSLLRKQRTLPDGILLQVAGLLGDPLRGSTALHVLEDQPKLSETVLASLPLSCKRYVWIREYNYSVDEDFPLEVSKSSLKMMRNRPSLPPSILEGVVKTLGSKYLRAHALEVIGDQAALSDKTLEAVVACLEFADCRDVAERILRKYPELYSSLMTKYIKPLCQVWLKRSFKANLSLYVKDSTIYASLPEKVYKVEGSCLSVISQLRIRL